MPPLCTRAIAPGGPPRIATSRLSSLLRLGTAVLDAAGRCASALALHAAPRTTARRQAAVARREHQRTNSDDSSRCHLSVSTVLPTASGPGLCPPPGTRLGLAGLTLALLHPRLEPVQQPEAANERANLVLVLICPVIESSTGSISSSKRIGSVTPGSSRSGARRTTGSTLCRHPIVRAVTTTRQPPARQAGALRVRAVAKPVHPV